MFVGLLSGCAAAPQAQGSQPAAAAPAAASGEENYHSRLTRDGCTVDLVKVCQSGIDQRLININGGKDFWTTFAESQHPHTDLIMTWYLPDQTIVGTIRCHIDVPRHKVTRAALTSGRAITDETTAYIKQHHWCEEDSTGAATPAQPPLANPPG